MLVAAGLIIDENADKLLVSRRRAEDTLGGLWEFPGGKVEPGENPRGALEREIEEELGIDVTIGAIVETLYSEYREFCVLILCYLTELVADSPAPRPLESDEVRWVPLSELDALTFVPADQPFVSWLAERARAGERPLDRLRVGGFVL